MKAGAKPTKPEDYLNCLPEPRKSELRTLDATIRKAAPKLERGVVHGMVGYGPYHYKYPSGREGDWYLLSLSSRKSYITLGTMAADEHGYLAEQFAPKMGKATCGKSCINFKKLEDIDLKVVTELVKESLKAWKKMGYGFKA